VTANRNNTRVLIVDDEPNIRLMLRTALGSEGYTIIEATNGREALDQIEREQPDVMILDLSMPQLDGMGVLRAMQEVPSHGAHGWPRTIVLTAYGSVPAAVQAIRLGALDFVEKPVSPDEIRTSVAAALKEPTRDAARGGVAGGNGDVLAGGYSGVLERVRDALRATKFTEAESLLMKAADLAAKDAAYFNLLGALCELQLQWKLARKYYGRAIAADGHYEPSQRNMRRLYELMEFGSSKLPLALGDEEAHVHLHADRRRI
jgi:CheY-like chemotaxis protein